MREVIAFAHGMSNFAHNRGTMLEQEQLLRTLLIGNATGNYAVTTSLPLGELKARLYYALNEKYRVREVVVVERVDLINALTVFKVECRRSYPAAFDESEFRVGAGQDRWRFGLVFSQHLYDLRTDRLEGLFEAADDRIRVLGLHAGVVGLLKYDPIKPRIPWGTAASFVEKICKRHGHSEIATASVPSLKFADKIGPRWPGFRRLSWSM